MGGNELSGLRANLNVVCPAIQGFGPPYVPAVNLCDELFKDTLKGTESLMGSCLELSSFGIAASPLVDNSKLPES